jgi:hypothetical protein
LAEGRFLLSVKVGLRSVMRLELGLISVASLRQAFDLEFNASAA